VGHSRRLRRDRSGQVEACQSAPKAQGVSESRFCKCLSRLEFFWGSVSICRKNTITPWTTTKLLRLILSTETNGPEIQPQGVQEVAPASPAVVDSLNGRRRELDDARITEQRAALADAAGQAFYNTPRFTLRDLRTLVQSARQRIATAAYSTQTLLCWHMGRRLDREHLQGGRAAYGKQILVTVSRELTAEYGRGFSPADSYGFAPGDPRNRPLTATAFLPRRDGGPCRVFRTIAEPPRAKFKSRR